MQIIKQTVSENTWYSISDDLKPNLTNLKNEVLKWVAYFLIHNFKIFPHYILNYV